MDQKSEIDDMLKALENPVAAPDTEPPVPDTDAPSMDAATDPPATSAPDEDDEDDSTGPKMEDVIAELKAEIAELKVGKSAPPKTSPPATDPPLEDKNFVDGIDIDDITRDPAEFNKVLNSIYRQAVLQARNDIKRQGEVIVKTVPSEVARKMKDSQDLVKLTRDFYSQNEDLQKFPKVVATIYEEVVAREPGGKIQDVLRKVGDETRSRLGLPKPKQGAKTPADNDSPPKLPRKKGDARIPKPTNEANPLRREIDEMNKSLRR
jgi:hypothetical protein